MRSKLRSIDRTILGRSPNGPLELRLSAVGPIQGLVFGAFGEISEEARTLLCYAADATAARTWVADGATSQEHAAALLKNRLYRRWGIKTAREYARIKIDGLVVRQPGLHQRARARRRQRTLLRPAASLRTRSRGIAPPSPL